jgi:hypothetical protein
VTWLRRAPKVITELARKVTALEFYEARLMPDYSGWWVYALGDATRGGIIFYAGQSEHLLRRLDDHRLKFGERFDYQQVWLIKVRDQRQADLVELTLIDYYQPEANTVGRSEELRKRNRTANSGFAPGHTYSAEYWAAQRAASLDSGQVAN